MSYDDAVLDVAMFVIGKIVLPIFVVGIVVALVFGLVMGVQWVWAWYHDDVFTGGVVINKQYIPAYTATEYNVVLKMPTTTYVPECWSVTLQGITTKGRAIEKHDYCLTQEQWYRVVIGQSLKVD